MKHTTWLQNCTPAHAIDGKTPYEMQHKKKPHLAGIQEFGVAAYIKDLKAGKLDAHAKVGHVTFDRKIKRSNLNVVISRSRLSTCLVRLVTA